MAGHAISFLPNSFKRWNSNNARKREEKERVGDTHFMDITDEKNYPFLFLGDANFFCIFKQIFNIYHQIIQLRLLFSLKLE